MYTIHIHLSPVLDFLPKEEGHHRALSWVPCAVLKILISCLFHVHGCVLMLIPISQFIPPPHFSPWQPYVDLYICAYFCFVNKFISTIFLGSTYQGYYKIFSLSDQFHSMRVSRSTWMPHLNAVI